MTKRGEHAGVNLVSARALLAGADVGSFDFDFLARDAAGRLAVFLGDRGSPLPSPTVARTTSTVLEEIATAISRPARAGPGAAPRSVMRARVAADGGENGYREAAGQAVELVFDTPRSAPTAPLHEPPMKDYPQLIVATPDGARTVRGLLDDYRGREVLARDGFAIAIEVLGPISHEEIHGTGACAGCRVLADPADPHPRSPEALAIMGFHVYGFAGSAWLRIVSPGRPSDGDDLAIPSSVPSSEVFFDETPSLSGRWFER